VKNKNFMGRGCEEGAADCILTVLGNNSCVVISEEKSLHLVEYIVELIFPSLKVQLTRRILTVEAPKLVS